MDTTSLWPQFKASEKRTPQSILKEQAIALEKATGGILKGEVYTGVRTSYPVDAVNLYIHPTPKKINVDADKFPETINNRNLTTAFYIKSPGLSNYRFELLNLEHPLKIYPFMLYDCVNGKIIEIKTEEAFIKCLKELFSSQEVANVITSLMEQSNSL